jgi:hypothetical protein
MVVLCCQQHATELRKAFTSCTVTYITTLNSQFDLTTSESSSLTSSVNVSSSVSNQEKTAQKTLNEYFKLPSGNSKGPKGPQLYSPSPAQTNTDNQSNDTSHDIIKANISQSIPIPALSSSYKAKIQSTGPRRNFSETTSNYTEDFSENAPPIPSWSDYVENLDPTLTGLKPMMKAVSDSNSLSFLIECGMIYCRVLSNKTPRSSLRGILDTTRPQSAIAGIPLKYGPNQLTLTAIPSHRHRHNHNAAQPDTHPPYLNVSMKDCDNPICPFTLWPRVENIQKSASNATLKTRIFNYMQEHLNTAQVSYEDFLQAQYILTFSKEHDIRLYDPFVKICEQVFLKGRPSSDE